MQQRIFWAGTPNQQGKNVKSRVSTHLLTIRKNVPTCLYLQISKIILKIQTRTVSYFRIIGVFSQKFRATCFSVKPSFICPKYHARSRAYHVSMALIVLLLVIHINFITICIFI
jgi:hypothetical protein